jgi:hypothetical protein
LVAQTCFLGMRLASLSSPASASRLARADLKSRRPKKQVCPTGSKLGIRNSQKPYRNSAWQSGVTSRLGGEFRAWVVLPQLRHFWRGAERDILSDSPLAPTRSSSPVTGVGFSPVNATSHAQFERPRLRAHRPPLAGRCPAGVGLGGGHRRALGALVLLLASRA